MARLNNTELLNELIERNQSFIDFAMNELVQLSDEKLNFKTSKTNWSIVECLIHVIKADEIYLPQFESKINAFDSVQYIDDHKGNLSYNTGWLGNYFAEGIVPKKDGVKNTMKSLKSMDPNTNIDLTSKEFKDSRAVIEAFVKQQTAINKQMEKAKDVNLGSIKIQTAIPLIKIKLGDAFRFVVGHNERHVFQAKKLL